MRRITEIPAECIACQWKGLVGGCGEPDHDGNPTCPECGKAVFIDYAPDELIGPDERTPWLSSTVNRGVKP